MNFAFSEPTREQRFSLRSEHISCFSAEKKQQPCTKKCFEHAKLLEIVFLSEEKWSTDGAQILLVTRPLLRDNKAAAVGFPRSDPETGNGTNAPHFEYEFLYCAEKTGWQS